MHKPDYSIFPILTTSNLILRNFSLNDSDEIYLLRSNLENAKYLDRQLADSIEDANEYIKKIESGIEEGKWINWGITKKDNPLLIGTICLWNFSDDFLTAELGYELNPAFQNNGIISEAIKPVLDYGFNTLKLKSIEAEVHKDNSKSIHLLEKYGFVQVNTLIEHPSLLRYQLNSY